MLCPLLTEPESKAGFAKRLRCWEKRASTFLYCFAQVCSCWLAQSAWDSIGVSGHIMGRWCGARLLGLSSCVLLVNTCHWSQFPKQDFEPKDFFAPLTSSIAAPANIVWVLYGGPWYYFLPSASLQTARICQQIELLYCTVSTNWSALPSTSSSGMGVRALQMHKGFCSWGRLDYFGWVPWAGSQRKNEGVNVLRRLYSFAQHCLRACWPGGDCCEGSECEEGMTGCWSASFSTCCILKGTKRAGTTRRTRLGVSAASIKTPLAACALAPSGVVPLSLQVEQHCQADQSISAAWMPWAVAGTD